MAATMLSALFKVLDDVERGWRCSGCPLYSLSRPLIFRPDRPVKIMVITEGPNRVEDKDFVASYANHPTFNYLNSLFDGCFRPEKNATAYWTHLRKCFLKDKEGKPLISGVDDKDVLKKFEEALSKCSKEYLVEEIKALRPEFIIAVGRKVWNFIREVMNIDNSIPEDFSEAFSKQKQSFLKGTLKTDEKAKFSICLIPHPSSQNRFWIRPLNSTKDILKNVNKEIKNILRA